MNAPQCKADYYAGAAKLQFGNQLRHWSGFAAAQADGFEGPYGIRTKQPGGPTAYRLPLDKALATWDQYMDAGYTPVVSECSDDSRLLLQGELQHTPEGLYLRYCDTLGLPMYLAFRKQDVPLHHEYGLRVLERLKQACWPKSWDMLQELLQVYDDPYRGPIVEFSAFDYGCGQMPGHNVVVWEVRGGY